MAKIKENPIYVRCGHCSEDFDERKVEFVNIEEDIFGADVLTFVCPRCKQDRKSYRRG